jgi:propanediol utilization protein
MEAIVQRVLEELKKMDQTAPMQFPVEASAKHIHLSQADVETLFGTGYELTFARELSQPGQFLAKERVTLIGPKGVIENVAVLGPARAQTQVEISITDSRALGVKPVIRESGKVNETPGLVIAAGGKAINLKEGAIVAKRHIHMSPENAVRLGVKDQQIVSVKIHSDRPTIFEDVLVRVNAQFNLSMHIDFDEANACALGKETKGEIL